ncbi:hypothetical protein F4778DRAFT_316561 [Xylariomycetidae sp. FL2044]|nr:hypothetical protein F4778DRAFT_316561 [Xylariomycetidae sp. FL2044]
MATAPATSGPKKLSFAKVVASHPKENIPLVSAARVTASAMDRRTQSPVTPATSVTTNKGAIAAPMTKNATADKPAVVSSQNSAATVLSTSGDNDHNGETEPAQVGRDAPATLGARPAPSLVVNGSSSSVEPSVKIENGSGVPSENSRKTESSSELKIGAKAPSLDGKSVASGTTFALDEKESLRPDDSASVKAAAEDDEAFSIRSSVVAGSRMGSEVARIHHLRLGDMPERRIVQILPEAQEQGVATPQSGASSQQPPVEQAAAIGPANTPNDAFNSIYGQSPDEKLLEAMQSPKDRIFLLRLEQEVINFVESSKEPYMDLPPNNSFCRMLTHKLADYYHMTHSFEAVQSSVRIYRTPFARVPPSLASLVECNPSSSNKTPALVLLPKKIMRRGEDDGSGQNSNSPSKATSEVGSDGKEKQVPREKMTREEREEIYKQARERIFGPEKAEASTPDTDDAGISRTSSVSTKEKSNLGKRGKTGKQRRDDSESFDSRSQYTPYYPPTHPNQVSWTPHFAVNGNHQYNGQMQQQPYPNPAPQAYGPPSQPYPMMSHHGYSQYGNMQSYAQQVQPHQPTPPRYPSNGSMGGYVPPVQPASAQPWQPGFNQAPSPVPYQSRPAQTAAPSQAQGNAGPHGIPYAFGQLPAHSNPNDPKSQHPIPGSYNRHAFNPKTQSFVPSNGMNPGQPPIYNMSAPHGSPQLAPHVVHSNYSSPAPYIGGLGYGMSRQGSNNSLPSYHPAQNIPQHPSAQLAQMPPQMPNKPGVPPGPPPGPGQTFSHLPNYGNPATLPQKPPSGI